MALSQQLPTGSTDVPPRGPTRRRKRSFLAIMLGVLVVLLVIGGFLGQRIALASQSAQTAVTPLPAGTGQYAELPLSAQQIDAIQHLSGQMKYMALASLYVDRMNLDDKLGQLIMLEFNETSYSDNLDYAINTLHVGGVIMYTIQRTPLRRPKAISRICRLDPVFHCLFLPTRKVELSIASVIFMARLCPKPILPTLAIQMLPLSRAY